MKSALNDLLVIPNKLGSQIGIAIILLVVITAYVKTYTDPKIFTNK